MAGWWPPKSPSVGIPWDSVHVQGPDEGTTDATDEKSAWAVGAKQRTSGWTLWRCRALAAPGKRGFMSRHLDRYILFAQHSGSIPPPVPVPSGIPHQSVYICICICICISQPFWQRPVSLMPLLCYRSIRNLPVTNPWCAKPQCRISICQSVALAAYRRVGAGGKGATLHVLPRLPSEPPWL
jgi:hypothetical protein